MKQHNCIIVRGGGDLATGVIQAVWRISRIVSGNGCSLGHPPSGGFVRGRV